MRDVVSAITGVEMYVVAFAVSVALLVMGNSLARLIGLGLLGFWLYFAVRLLRRRFADRNAESS